MFNTSFYPVHPALKLYFNFHFAAQLTECETSKTLFTATPEAILLFYFGSKQSSIFYDFPNTPNKSYTFQKDQLWLGGMHNEPIRGQFGASLRFACAVCTPLGVQCLLRDNSTSILNKAHSFETLNLHKKFDGLAEKLYYATTNHEAIQLIESYLIKYFSAIDTPFSIKDIKPVSDYIVRQKGVVKIQQLEEKFHVSRRWLEMQFASQIGFSPKEFARIIRFKAVLAQAIMTPSVSWSQLVEEFGYYDQSHLIRDFYDFTSESPKQYFQNSLSKVNNIFLKELEEI